MHIIVRTLESNLIISKTHRSFLNHSSIVYFNMRQSDRPEMANVQRTLKKQLLGNYSWLNCVELYKNHTSIPYGFFEFKLAVPVFVRLMIKMCAPPHTKYGISLPMTEFLCHFLCRGQHLGKPIRPQIFLPA